MPASKTSNGHVCSISSSRRTSSTEAPHFTIPGLTASVVVRHVSGPGDYRSRSRIARNSHNLATYSHLNATAAKLRISTDTTSWETDEARGHLSVHLQPGRIQQTTASPFAARGRQERAVACCVFGVTRDSERAGSRDLIGGITTRRTRFSRSITSGTNDS